MIGVNRAAATNEYSLRLEWAYQRAIRARAEVEDEDDIAEAAQRRVTDLEGRIAAVEPTQRASLVRRLDLDAQQVDFLWTAVAASVDGRMAPHLEALGGTPARRGLSPALYAALTGTRDGTSAALAHWLVQPNPLLDGGLVTAGDNASHAARTYLASPRLIGFLSGTSRVAPPLRVVSASRDGLLHDETQRGRLGELAAIVRRDPGVAIVIEGPRGSGRVTAVACAAGDAVVLDASRVSAGDLGAALTALRRESVLDGRIPVLANADHILGDERPDQRRAIGAFIDAVEGPLVITVTVPGTDLATERPLVRIPWDVAGVQARAALWTAAAERFGITVVGDLAPIAHRYQVGPAAIERAVASARLIREAGEPLDAAALAVGLRHNIAERLGGLATRVEVTQTWDDLVLGEDTVDQIQALVGRIRHAHRVLEQWGYRQKIARGTGTAALLSGPPGTGKTMVAGLIARELDLELYQVDLSKVVSKWVGETEKNLARVFDAAEEGHALLLFDEADALFGQRTTETKGAVDRYANLEVNYLLQRVEAFGGITILTTNLETAIDTALKRRLAAHIVFAAPDEDERASLWRRQTATGAAPLASDIDVETLARAFPNMTGANIRNAAIAAAFLAAGDGSRAITQEHLMRAGRAEYRSMGHMVSDAAGRRSARS